MLVIYSLEQVHWGNGCKCNYLGSSLPDAAQMNLGNTPVIKCFGKKSDTVDPNVNIFKKTSTSTTRKNSHNNGDTYQEKKSTATFIVDE